MTEQELLQELCGGCNGCSTGPKGISDLCGNPLEKYVEAKSSTIQCKAYFRGRRDGLTILEANTLSKVA